MKEGGMKIRGWSEVEQGLLVGTKEAKDDGTRIISFIWYDGQAFQNAIEN